MSDAMPFWCPQCGSYRHLAARPTDERTRCIRCDTFFPHEGRLFGSDDWKTTNDPFRMAAVLTELGREPSARKWRLLACGIGRVEFDWCRNPWFLDALDLAEKWADTGEQPRGASQCATHFAQSSDWDSRRREQLGWVRIGRRTVSDNSRLHPDDMSPPQTRTVAAVLLRDFFFNPF